MSQIDHENYELALNMNGKGTAFTMDNYQKLKIKSSAIYDAWQLKLDSLIQPTFLSFEEMDAISLQNCLSKNKHCKWFLSNQGKSASAEFLAIVHMIILCQHIHGSSVPNNRNPEIKDTDKLSDIAATVELCGFLQEWEPLAENAKWMRDETVQIKTKTKKVFSEMPAETTMRAEELMADVNWEAYDSILEL